MASMGLRSRLFLLVILPIALVVGVYGVMRARQEVRDVVDAEARLSAATARAVQIAVEHALRDRQLVDIQRLVEELVTHHPHIERVVVVDRGLGLVAAVPPRPGDTRGLEHLREVIATGQPRRQLGAPGSLRYAVPLGGRGGSPDGALEMVFSVTRVEDLLGATTREVALRLGALVLVLTALTALAMRRLVLRPLSRLLASMRAFGEGRPWPALPAVGRDELAQVAQAFNRMVAQLEEARARLVAESEHALDLEKQLRRVQTLTVAGKLTSALAHEVGTPLNVISGRAEMALRALPPEHPAHADLATIAAQAERISGIIRTLLDSVRGQKPEVQRLALDALLPQLAALLGHDARRRRIALEVSVPRGLPSIAADPGQIQQVVLNLLVNALDTTPGGGRVQLAARAAPRDDRHGVEISVSDTGPGVAPDLRDRIFEPFFTTKPPGEGTGLGLSISRDIVREHGGRLTVDGAPGAGATFTVWLPSADAEAA
jgi:signal transduction histidine kinase